MDLLLIGDNIVNSIEFDALDLSTRSSVTSSGNVTRPSFDFISVPTGLGFSQDVSVVQGDTIDYVLDQVIKKKNIKLTVYFKGTRAYAKYKEFSVWFGKYNDLNKYRIRFSYLLNGVRRYVEVCLIDLEIKGREGNFVNAEITFQALTPFYEDVYESIIITESENGKIYPYRYPYNYGGGAYIDANTINNDFIKEIPLMITLNGPMATPYVNILEMNNGVLGETYGRVQFNDSVSLKKGEQIVIDAFSNRIYKRVKNSGTGVVAQEDLFDAVNKNYQAFLYAKPGMSRIASSLDDASSSCEVYSVRYVL